MEDVAAGEAEDALEIRRRQHVAVNHAGAEPGRDLIDQREHAVRERVPRGVPVGVPQRIRHVLHEQRRDVLAGRGEAVVERGRDRQLDHGVRGQAARRRGGERVFELREARRADVDRAAQLRTRGRARTEFG